ncbi:MAG: type IV pilin protein [Bdellovibrionales bacterium]
MKAFQKFKNHLAFFSVSFFKINSKKAFSILELLVVVGIIGVIATVAIPAYQSYKNEGKDTALKQVLIKFNESIIEETSFDADATFDIAKEWDRLKKLNSGLLDKFILKINDATSCTGTVAACVVKKDTSYCLSIEIAKADSTDTETDDESIMCVDSDGGYFKSSDEGSTATTATCDSSNSCVSKAVSSS